MSRLVSGVYTAYKPFLNKDEDIIKQLQKVSVSLEDYITAETFKSIY